jgi:hypothetical protein
VRNVADAAHVLNHLDIRFSQYDVRFGATDAEHRDRMWQFREELTAAIRLNESLVRLCRRRCGTRAAIGSLGGARRSAATSRDRARPPPTTSTARRSTRRGAVAVLLHGCCGGGRAAAARPPRGWLRPARASRARPLHEAGARYSTGVHNRQSAYDTYVKPTRLSVEIPELRSFRGHVSLALHLFEVASHLVHFYERHEGEELRGITKDRIAKLVPREQVLHHVVQFAARNAADVVLRVVPLAQALLPRLAPQQTIELELPEGVTLHARPLSLIFGVVRHHKMPVEIVIEGKSTSAGSIPADHVRRPLPGARRGRRSAVTSAPLSSLPAAGLRWREPGERGFDGFPKALGYLRPT